MTSSLFRRPSLSAFAVVLMLSALTACVGLDVASTEPLQPPIGNPEDNREHDAAEAPAVAAYESAQLEPDADAAPTSAHRRRHLPLATDPGTPWWMLVAGWESEQAAINGMPKALGAKPFAQAPAPADDHPLDSAATQQTDDLWQRIRNGFQLGDKEHRLVRPYIDWYASNQAYLDRVVERAQPFLYDIVQEIEARGMPMEIALLPVVESAFQPFAYSPGRAAGIWQFIPATGKRYGLKQNWWYDGRRDVPRATTAALDYLEVLHKHFDGDWLLALASYNSGEGRVARAVKKNRQLGRPTDFWSLDLPRETVGYVPKLLAISAVIHRPDAHGISLASIPDEAYLAQIDIGSQIDLALAAELAELPIETLYQLNPAFNRWATDPKGPHVLSLPIERIDSFAQALAEVDDRQRVRWQRHQVRQGETLGHIARKYQTSVNLLQEVNGINDKWIRAGKSIIIPVATKDLEDYLSADRRRVALQDTKRAGHKIQHRVKAGDTFWDLSRKYKVKLSRLAAWNGMSPRDTLKPGQQLVIWTDSRDATTARFGAPPRNATRQQLHYKVRAGDSLALIAQKFSVTVEKLRLWNSLKKGKYLQPGQRLTLFVDVTQQS
ncbi:MAG: LysM peptidoglycan-binding domain-containing protein [Gammaproteobacteria bacterium]|nr:LysM peptidoglycan-binding domain-containing protein [Gammaproteobacteria bacterium]